MNELAKSFFNEIKDKTLSYRHSAQKLETFTDDEFVEFDNSIEFKSKIYWTQPDYFSHQVGALSLNFSKERCLHLIEVKQYLQQLAVNGFYIEENDTPSPIKTTASENKRGENSMNMQTLLTDKANLLKGYQPEAKLTEAIAADDIDKVHTILMLNIDNNRLSMQQVLQSLLYTMENYPKAFVEYSISKFHKELDSDESNWNYDYFISHQGYLNYNFCVERCLHLINVRDKLEKDGVTEFKRIVVEHKVESRTQHSQEQERPQQSQSQSEQQSSRENQGSNQTQDDFVKKVLLIGGAALVGLLALITIFK